MSIFECRFFIGHLIKSRFFINIKVVFFQKQFLWLYMLIINCIHIYNVAGLYPSIVNLASHATISSNATCGLNGPAKYCKLVEHVDRRWIQRGSQCSASVFIVKLLFE